MTRSVTTAKPKVNPERRWFTDEWPDGCTRCHRVTVKHSRQGLCAHCAGIILDGKIPTALDALILKGVTFDRGPRLKRRPDVTVVAPTVIDLNKKQVPVSVTRLAEEVARHYDTRMAERIANIVMHKMETRLADLVRVNVRAAIGEMLA